MLAPDTTLVFGGDSQDKGIGDIRLVKQVRLALHLCGSAVVHYMQCRCFCSAVLLFASSCSAVYRCYVLPCSAVPRLRSPFQCYAAAFVILLLWLHSHVLHTMATVTPGRWRTTGSCCVAPTAAHGLTEIACRAEAAASRPRAAHHRQPRCQQNAAHDGTGRRGDGQRCGPHGQHLSLLGQARDSQDTPVLHGRGP